MQPGAARHLHPTALTPTQLMECPACRNTLRPGIEIALPNGGAEVRHCPYCLAVLPRSDARLLEAPGQTNPNVSVLKFALRSTVRGRFVDRLLERSPDGVVHCPQCNHRLTRADELALRYGLWFRCSRCCVDLIHLAYREEAYRSDRWLPVVAAVAAQELEPRCADCSYLGAVASASRQALSFMTSSHPEQAAILDGVLARHSWSLPDCDWSCSCDAVRQYRLRAAQGLALL